MCLRYLILLLFVGCATKTLKSSDWKNKCGAIDEIKYCYHEIGEPDLTKDPIVMMHGLYDSERVFLEPTKMPSNYPELINAMPAGTRIIVISFGPGFMLTAYPNRTKEPKTATLARFKELLAPYGTKFRLLSHSMGGFNAAVLMRAYPEMWSKAVLINPMLITKDTDPWNLIQICPSCLMTKANFDNLAQWKKERPILSSVPTMVTACPIDIFGLYPGAQEYSKHVIDDDPICSHWTWNTEKVLGFLK